MSFVVRCNIYIYFFSSCVTPIGENTIISYLIMATCETMLLFIEAKAKNLSLIELQSRKT